MVERRIVNRDLFTQSYQYIIWILKAFYVRRILSRLSWAYLDIAYMLLSVGNARLPMDLQMLQVHSP